MGMYEDVCKESDIFREKLENIKKLTRMPETSPVSTDWHASWLLKAVSFVLQGKDVKLADGTIFIKGDESPFDDM